MSGRRRTTTLAPLILILACLLHQCCCAVKIDCTVTLCAEGYNYTVSMHQACDRSWSAVDDTGKETVVATHTGNVDGVVRSSVNILIMRDCKDKMKFEADCDSSHKSQGSDLFTSVCETKCFEIERSIKEAEKERTVKDSASHANFAAPVLIRLLLLAAAGVRI